MKEEVKNKNNNTNTFFLIYAHRKRLHIVNKRTEYYENLWKRPQSKEMYTWQFILLHFRSLFNSSVQKDGRDF